MPKVSEGVARMFTEGLWESAVGQRKESTAQDKESVEDVGSARNTANATTREYYNYRWEEGTHPIPDLGPFGTNCR